MACGIFQRNQYYFSSDSSSLRSLLVIITPGDRSNPTNIGLMICQAGILTTQDGMISMYLEKIFKGQILEMQACGVQISVNAI